MEQKERGPKLKTTLFSDVFLYLEKYVWQKTYRAQTFTLLKADLYRDINRASALYQ